MPCPFQIFSQSDYLIQIVDKNLHTEWQTVQIQKPTDLDLHCLQRQGISGFSRTRVKLAHHTCSIIPHINNYDNMKTFSQVGRYGLRENCKIKVTSGDTVGITFSSCVSIYTFSCYRNTGRNKYTNICMRPSN